jgi:hypothetical protein
MDSLELRPIIQWILERVIPSFFRLVNKCLRQVSRLSK